VCASSRCVLLTGKHTGHAFVRGNREMGGWDPEAPEGQLPLPAEAVTIAELLRDRGYATGAVGKWGLGGPGSTGHPCFQGFDNFYGYLCQRVAHNYYPTHLWKNGERDVLAGNEYFAAHQKLAEPLATEAEYWERYTAPEFAPDRMIEEALDFVRTSKDEPFFLLFASPVPHAAIQVPPAELDAYPAEWDAAPYLGQKGYLPHPSPRRGYAAMVSRFDHDVGLLLGLVDELGLGEDTVVMFSSDNGPTFNGGTDSTFFESAAGLRGLKTMLYEGGIRVPFVVHWPGRIEGGAVTDLVSGFQDVLPTVLELAGLPQVSGVDGISLAPTLLAEGEQEQHEYLYWEYRGQQALRLGQWKALRLGLKREDTTLELYDLATDPAESTDVAAAEPEVAARIAACLAAAHVPSQVFPLPTIDPPAEDEAEADDGR